MKKYKNVAGFPLYLDCLSHTRYVRPGETVTLPESRDVRYYSDLKLLVWVREKEKKKINVASFKKPKKKKRGRPPKKASKEEIEEKNELPEKEEDKQLEPMETE